MTRLAGLLLCLTVLFLASTPSWLFAEQERILDFQSRIQIHEDASLGVTETITVQALGQEIKRGIYRWWITNHTDNLGLALRTRYEILSVQRDGDPEMFFAQDNGDKFELYIGNEGVYLPPGVYTYTIAYRTWNQIEYFDTYDELYWNVTGNGWGFPIEKASCAVTLPPGATLVQKAAYTGETGAQGKDFTSSEDGKGNVLFETTRPLPPENGLTIAVAWPKGLVHEPDFSERLRGIIQDNLALLGAMFGALLTLCYYVVVWFRVGKDPARWTIVPLYEPPQNLSPAATRFVMRMGFDNKAFAAAIVSLAVKGHLEIEEERKTFGKTMILMRREQSLDTLSKGEQAVLQKLFSKGDRVELKQKNHTLVSNTLKELKKTLKLEYEKAFFNKNSGYLIPGMVLSLVSLLVIPMGQHGDDRFAALFATIWLSIWTVGCLLLLARAWMAWKDGNKKTGIMATLILLPFLGGEVVGLLLYTSVASFLGAACLLTLVAMAVVFYQLLKAPTFAGRRLMDEIEGFKLFLSVAEKERLELLHPPEQTPELFEKYLPYALALDVENKWNSQFAAVLERAGTDGTAYHPTWYHGESWHTLGAAGFAGSLSSSLASAATSASGSSGSGGGGFSGGGGGGGGGGGW